MPYSLLKRALGLERTLVEGVRIEGDSIIGFHNRLREAREGGTEVPGVRSALSCVRQSPAQTLEGPRSGRRPPLPPWEHIYVNPGLTEAKHNIRPDN